MLELMIAAPSSGSGKTTIVCGLLEILKRLGYNPCAFKCGPDYIDPMFHRAVLGVPSHNLDLFLSEKPEMENIYRQGCRGHHAAICEGAMGYYDGVGGSTEQASAWHVATVLGIPTILVVRPSGSSLTLAAWIKGICTFRNPNQIAGILLNRCSSTQYHSLAPMLERETGVPVLGFLPDLPESVIESRHLGLYTAQEIGDLTEKIEVVARQMERSVDIQHLISICTQSDRIIQGTGTRSTIPTVRIAVAWDEAFCFAYTETLELFERLGAEICKFSPIHDPALPEGVGGLYLPGGYPELYAAQLAANSSMKADIRRAVVDHMPTIAECGGFLYLGKALYDDCGVRHEMVGVLEGEAAKRQKLVRFGYADVTAKNDSLLFRAGESVPIHEFHYWESTHNGSDLHAVKPVSGRKWDCAVTTESLYAGFPHLYFAGSTKLAQRFITVAKEWNKTYGNTKNLFITNQITR